MLTITEERQSKLGDYLLHPQKGHMISINGDLNPYSFSITLIHELAHLKAFKLFSSKIKPHGEEWKESFRALMYYPIRTNAFPDEIKIALMQHMKNPKASSVRDIELRKVLMKYDEGRGVIAFVEDVPFDRVFTLKNGTRFQKVEKLRTRYKCVNVDTSKLYYVNATAEVIHVD
jgi:hypothetical protein